MGGTKDVTLPSGTKVVYKDFFTTALFLDLQDIPEHMAGSRLRLVAKTLVVSIGDKSKPEEVVKAIDDMDLHDFAPLAEALTNVIEAELGKKNRGGSGTEVPPTDAGKGKADKGDGASGGDA